MQNTDCRAVTPYKNGFVCISVTPPQPWSAATGSRLHLNFITFFTLELKRGCSNPPVRQTDTATPYLYNNTIHYCNICCIFLTQQCAVKNVIIGRYSVLKNVDQRLKAWFWHIQLSLDGTSTHALNSWFSVYWAYPIHPTSTRCQWTLSLPCRKEAKLPHFMSTQLGWLCSYLAERLFGGGKPVAGTALPFGTNSAPRQFLQHSDTDTEKHHAAPLRMRSGCCGDRMTTPTMHAGTGREEGSDVREGRKATEGRKVSGGIKKKLSNAALICHA